MSSASTQFEDERHLAFTMQRRHRQAAIDAQIRIARAADSEVGRITYPSFRIGSALLVKRLRQLWKRPATAALSVSHPVAPRRD